MRQFRDGFHDVVESHAMQLDHGLQQLLRYRAQRGSPVLSCV